LGTALISRHLAGSRNKTLAKTPFAALSGGNTSTVLTVLAVGEVVADKLPIIPSRTEPGPLIVRALIGGFVGAAACSERRDNAVAGALVGAAAAVGASFAAYYLRRWLTRDIGLPDPIVATAEDSLALAIGQRAVRS
jgi:uncharacterized membrane protein